MANMTESQLLNDALLTNLSTPGMEKSAVDAVNDFTRLKMREDGFARKIMPPLVISNDQLDRRLESDKPYKIIDKEVDNQPAQSVPFATLPTDQYIRGSRYPVTFDRILSPRFTKDVDELRTYTMDIRQVISDNAIKDMLAEEDTKFIQGVNSALVGQDSIVPASSKAQWKTITGGITRDTTQDMLKIMPDTPFHIETHTALINNITIREFFKWGRDEMGGDFAQDIAKNGWSTSEFLGINWIVTIKTDLVPNDNVFMFGDPKFIGKMYLLEDTTMYIKKEAWFLEFFSYECLGATIGHTGGLARATFE